MRILFVMRHAMYLRNYESAVRLIAARGHDLHLGFTERTPKRFDDAQRHLLDRLLDEFPHVTFGPMPSREDFRAPDLHYFRQVRSLLRYYEPLYAQASKLRGRFEKYLPWTSRLLKSAGVARSATLRSLLSRLLSSFDRAVPSDLKIEQAIAEHRPDLLLITPLVQWDAADFDYLRSARKLGVRSVFCVTSWDNLTNKGLVHIQPDFTILWNEAQKQEAVELHHLPPERIAVTGAQIFDQWFDRSASTDRATFCRRIGFDPNRPIVLYLCSSPFIAEKEVGFVDEWLGRMRSCPHAALRNAQVLVRPHPQNTVQWQNADLSHHGGVEIWPRAGAVPIDDGSRNDFFDSMHHSAAVVGLNTSALIEAGIVGRRCFTILTPQFDDTQEGTLHFAHLVRDEFLVCSKSFDEHFLRLSREVEGDPTSGTTIRRFLQSFIRPHGLDHAAAPLVVDAIESAASLSPIQDAPLGAGERLLRGLLAAVASRRALTPRKQGKRPKDKKHKVPAPAAASAKDRAA
jgi:hypothetical protein